MNSIIESLKTKEEIVNILKENTHEDISLLKAIYDDNIFKRFFRGIISDDSFKIQRCVRSQRGLVPLIYGNIEETKEGTKINIKIKRYKGINIFLGVWFSFLMLLFIFITFASPKYFFIPLLMLVYGFLLNFITYKTESKKAMSKLQEMFK